MQGWHYATVSILQSQMKTDRPAFTAKLLDTKYYPWYGSAALPVYLPVHKEIQKKSY